MNIDKVDCLACVGLKSFDAIAQLAEALRKGVARCLVDSIKLAVNSLLEQFIEVSAVTARFTGRTEDVVAGDAAQPRSEGTLSVKLVDAFPCGDDGLLENVVNRGVVEGNRVNESIQHVGVLSNENVEEVFCAHGDLRDAVSLISVVETIVEDS